MAPNGEAALDLMMPVMDGWALLDELEASGGHRPRVIVVSARTAQDDRLRAARYGVEGFVPKPFDMDELLGMIRAILPRPQL